MPDKYTLRLVSTSIHDQLVLKSLLGVISQRTSRVWSYAEDNVNADVLIVDVDKDYPDIATLKRANHCHAIVSFSETSRYVPQMSFSLHKPLRAKDVLVLLTDIERALPATTSQTLSSPTPAQVSTNSTQKAFTSSKVLDQLLHATKHYKDAVVEINIGKQRMYFDNRRKKIFVSGALVFSQMTDQQIVCRTIEKVPLTALESLTFTDIFYELTLSQSSVSLAHDLSTHDEFTIRQWPNMANSRHAKSMIRMAAYFAKQKATVHKAAQDLAVELNDIIGFINAVHSQDLLVSYPMMAVANAVVPDVHNTTNPEPVQQPTSSGIGGLFGRIRQRLGI